MEYLNAIASFTNTDNKILLFIRTDEIQHDIESATNNYFYGNLLKRKKKKTKGSITSFLLSIVAVR